MTSYVLYNGDSCVGVFDSLESCGERMYEKQWKECTDSQKQYTRFCASTKRRTKAKRQRPISWLIVPALVGD